MDRLWAPWRLSYITAAAKPAPADDCFLCRGLAESDDRANLIVSRGPLSAVVLNRYPYNNGHVLVAPSRHAARLDELTAGEILELQTTLAKLVGVFDAVMRPDGYNIGLNLGRPAGAGLPGHLHWHLVPRWNGDTNFMPVLGDTKVISQSLESLYDLLAPRLS